MGYYFTDEDAERLRREITALQALEYVGADMEKKGAHYLILCPRPEHDDKNLGSCVVTPDRGGRCYCFACQKEIFPLDILMWMGGMGYYEANSVLAELSGHPKDYESGNRWVRKRAKKKRLSREDITLLGIASRTRIRQVTGYAVQRECRTIRDIDGSYVRYAAGTGKNPLHELQDDNPSVYRWLIRNKCMEQMVRYSLLIQRIRNPGSMLILETATAVIKAAQITMGEFIGILEEECRRLESIYFLHGGKKVDRCQLAEFAVCSWVNQMAETWSHRRLQGDRELRKRQVKEMEN